MVSFIPRSERQDEEELQLRGWLCRDKRIFSTGCAGTSAEKTIQGICQRKTHLMPRSGAGENERLLLREEGLEELQERGE